MTSVCVCSFAPNSGPKSEELRDGVAGQTHGFRLRGELGASVFEVFGTLLLGDPKTRALTCCFLAP